VESMQNSAFQACLTALCLSGTILCGPALSGDEWKNGNCNKPACFPGNKANCFSGPQCANPQSWSSGKCGGAQPPWCNKFDGANKFDAANNGVKQYGGTWSKKAGGCDMKDGGSMQQNPDGSRTCKKPDGSEYRINPDGSAVWRRADGTRVEHRPDGSQHTWTANGGHYVLDAEGIGTHPDGTVVTRSAMDGTKVYKKPDGSSWQRKSNGTEIITRADGSSLTKNPDGSGVMRAADGSILMEKKRP
jgi:hypothetical protein